MAGLDRIERRWRSERKISAQDVDWLIEELARAYLGLRGGFPWSADDAPEDFRRLRKG